jgi:TolA-binding protein
VAAGDYERAESGFDEWLARYAWADHPRTPQAMFWLGYCREKLGHPERARETYGRLLASYGDSPAAAQARQRIERMTLP